MKSTVVCIISALMFSCQSSRPSGLDYTKLLSFDFMPYKGLSFFVRDYETSGDPIIFVQDYSFKRGVCGNKVFVLDKKTNEIVRSDIKRFADDCTLNLSSNDSLLVKKFNSLKIRRLMVDTLGNIFISQNRLDEYELVKLVNYKDSSRRYESWKDLGENWLEKQYP